MILQIVMGESVAVLDGIELEKSSMGDASKKEARADMAPNNAIHNEFKPHIALEEQAAVGRLRCVLKFEEEHPDC